MISWKCTTMGRVSTLEETLFSFLNQDDLSDCEMVIVNDYPEQFLIYHHPQVRIYNVPPFKTIGDKENFAVEQCRGEIIAVTDDDDVYMPNHNRNIKKFFVPEKGILHWMGAFYNEPDIEDIDFIGNSGMVYSKEAWNKVGKHPIMNAGGDSVFSKRIHDLMGETVGSPPFEEISAFYRWRMITNPIYHQSGMGTDVGEFPNIIERHKEHIAKMRREGRIPTGSIDLDPHWKEDYYKMLQRFINRKYASRN